MKCHQLVLDVGKFQKIKLLILFTTPLPTRATDALMRLAIMETKKNVVKESKKFLTKERLQEKGFGLQASFGTPITEKNM